jgi:peptide/nickel transport system substrate-binding protein
MPRQHYSGAQFMSRSSHRLSRSVLQVFALLLVGTLLAACGGGSNEPTGPTPTAMPMATIAPTTDGNASTPEASASTPVAQASPIASADGWTRSVTREEFQAQLMAAFPMEDPTNREGTIILGGSGDISTLNPVLANDELTIQVVGSIYETLAGGSPIDGQPVPGLADYWEISADRLTYIFHLNRTARWHDGVDVTADDVAFSFDAALNPNTGSSYTALFRENIASYRVIDEHTFEVVARDQFVSFMQNGPASIFIVPKHLWESVPFATWSVDGGSNGTDPSRVVGSGPFRFGEWIQGDRVQINRNDDYYNGPANLASVIFRVLPDTDAAVLALENGDTDIMQIIPAPDTARIQDHPDLEVQIYEFFQMTLYMSNLGPDGPQQLKEREVRQAMMMAIDRDSITENIFYGFGEAAVGTQPPVSPAYAPDRMTPALAYDPAAATALLDSIGWRDTNNDGVLDRGGVKLEITLIYGSGDQTTNQIVAYLQEAWKAVGIEVELDPIDFSLMVERLEAKDFELAFLAFSLGTDGSQSSLFACDQIENGLNFAGFCSEAWDALDEAQQREFDPAARTELLIQQSQLVWEEQPVGPVRFGIARTGYSTAIHNFHPNGFGFLWSLPYVWRAP